MIDRLNAALEDRYHIERELGEGGMATVYLAEDVKHRRNVALKVLRPELAAVVGAERFLAEIETTAALQHPHILPLFDSGQADGFLFYVMPYVEGESLREKLDRERQLPVDEAVELARKVADALQYAHEQGVIHRDIKPANILLSRGNPLVADFGIALAVSSAGGGRITETGLSLGTPHYMSPEQAAGDRSLDPRSDVYALGCVLYEMLVGEPPFPGPTPQAVLAKILTTTPQRTAATRHTVPPHVDAAVAKALEKLPADRFDSVADFRKALGDPAFRHAPRTETASGGRGREPREGRWPGTATSVAALLLVLVTAALTMVVTGRLWGGADRPAASTAPVTRFSISVDDLPNWSELDISADGSMLVWAPARGGALRLRRMEVPEVGEIPGTEGGHWPVFSPGGAWIAYIAEDAIRRVPVSGGTPLRVATHPGSAYGLDWGDDGTLVFATPDGLYTVPATGGTPERVVEGQAFAIRHPHMLPGGGAVLFSEIPIGAEPGPIRLLDLESGEVRTLLDGGTDARYVETGHLVYGHTSQALFAVPFDLERREVTGRSFPILEGVRVVLEDTFYGLGFAASSTGTAAYVSGTEVGEKRILALADRSGARDTLPLPPGGYDSPTFSPDGRRLAYVGADGTRIFVYDLVLGTNTPVTSGGGSVSPQWSPGGDSLVFGGIRGGSRTADVFWLPSDGSEEASPLWSGDGFDVPTSVSPDGKRLLLTVFREGAGSVDMEVVDLDGEPAASTYLNADWEETGGRISPDGRWVAYQSTEDGSWAIYVRAFPEPGAKHRVSEGGGQGARWSPAGDELFYWSGDTLRAATVRTGPSFEVLGRTPLFHADVFSYDVRPDGSGFVLVENPQDPTSTGSAEADGEGEAATGEPERLMIVVNWFEELRRRAGEAPLP